jgi:hypothetical protein
VLTRDQYRQSDQHRAERAAEHQLGALSVLPRGCRKVGTPLAMASIPVSAEQPAANAFSAIAPSASVMWIGCAAPTTVAECARSRPTTMTPKIAARNHHRYYERACALRDAPQVHGSDQDQADQAQREHVVGAEQDLRPGAPEGEPHDLKIGASVLPAETCLTFGLTGGGARAIAGIDPACHG